MIQEANPTSAENAVAQAEAAIAVGTRRLEELSQTAAAGDELSLQQLSVVPIPVAVQLGRVRLSLSNYPDAGFSGCRCQIVNIVNRPTRLACGQF